MKTNLLKTNRLKNKATYLFQCGMVLMLAVVMQSCAGAMGYYQVLRAQVPEGMQEDDNFAMWEDEQCKLYYDLWTAPGYLTIVVENKTDSILWLDLTRSFFVRNGASCTYYQGRSWKQQTSTVSTSSVRVPMMWGIINVGQSQSVVGNNSEQQAEQPVVAIAPHAFVVLQEFKVCEEHIIDCDLREYPTASKNEQTMRYDAESSPVHFFNYLTYHVGDTGKAQVVEHKFYISEISNYLAENVMRQEPNSRCGSGMSGTHPVCILPIKNHGSTFYIKYYMQY